jgi:aspartate aminotransferase
MVEDSPTLAINQQVQSMWARGKRVYHMGFGESRFPVHPRLRSALAANVHRQSYLPVAGLPALREAIASQVAAELGLSIVPEQVVVASGSKPLLFALQLALDAELFIPTPTWVSYAPQARLLGRPVTAIPPGPTSDFEIDVNAVEQAFAASKRPQKLLVLNSPNNPTGRMLSASTVRALSRVCQDYGAWIISDEIYAGVAHGNRPHTSPACYYPDGTFIFGGLSKELSLGGWRMGHCIFPEAQRNAQQAVTAIASEVWSSASAPIQYAALTAYSGEPDVLAYRELCARLHAARTRWIWHGLVEAGIRCPEPHGGFYLMPDFNAFRQALSAEQVYSSADLSLYLLNRYQISSLPGSAFGLSAEVLAVRLATSFLDLEDDVAGQAWIAAWESQLVIGPFGAEQAPQMTAVLAQFRRFTMDHELQ